MGEMEKKKGWTHENKIEKEAKKMNGYAEWQGWGQHREHKPKQLKIRRKEMEQKLRTRRILAYI